MEENRFNRFWAIVAFSQCMSCFDFANVNQMVVIIIIMEDFGFMHWEFNVVLVLWTNMQGDSKPAVTLYKTQKSN